MITINQLKGICPLTRTSVLQPFVEPLSRWMERYGINTPLRRRHFIAQVAHESGSFNYVKELASGAAYEGRKDLGNVNSGDGVRFKGRGPIQITGRKNYEKCSLAIFGDRRLLDHPELLETPEYGVKAACWFWSSNGLNTLADADNVVAVSRRINGGVNGMDDRKRLYELAKKFIV